MPRVDPYPGDQVRTQPLPNLRHTVVRPAEDFRGMAGFGEQLTRVAPVVAQIYQDQQKKANDLFVVTAKRQFNELYRLQALSGPENRGANGTKGLLTMQGMEAHDKLDANFADWKSQADMIVSQAKNPDQRLLVEQLRDNEAARYYDQGMQHSSNEYQKARVGEHNALLLSSVQTAAAAAGTAGYETVVQDQLGTQAQLLTVSGHELGKTDEETKSDIAKMRSQTHVAVLNHLLDSGDDQAATAYYDRVAQNTPEHPSEILEQDAGPIRNKLEINSTDGGGERLARQVFEELGPKNATDPVKTFQMQQRLRELATGAPNEAKLFARGVQYLSSLEAAWHSEQVNTKDANMNPLYTAFDQRVPLATVRAMPEFIAGNWDTQKAIIDLYQSRDATELAQAHAAYNWKRGLVNDAYTDIERAERMKELSGADVYYDLMDHPAQMVNLSAEALSRYRPMLSKAQFAQVHRQWEDVYNNVNAATVASVNRDIILREAADAGLDFVYSTTKTEAQKDQLNRLDIAVREAMVAEQLARTGKTGQRQVLSLEDQTKIAHDVVSQKTHVPGVWGDHLVISATVQPDDLGKAYVPFKEIPPAVRTMLRDTIRAAPAKAGTTDTRDLSDPEIDRRYGGAMERAWAASLAGAGQSAWQAILYQGINKYTVPAAPGSPAARAAQTGLPPPTTRGPGQSGAPSIQAPYVPPSGGTPNLPQGK